VPHIKGGRLRALAVTSEKRFPTLPEIPTIAEAGVPGYAMTNWYGLLVQGNTPKASITKLHAELVRILALPEVRERLVNEGASVIASAPDQFAAFLKNEIEKNARIVEASGMTASN
jgi:tripartite-type tricarboxylate transporter receptor subunit TctC